MQNTKIMRINGKSYAINYPVVSSQLNGYKFLNSASYYFLKVYNLDQTWRPKNPYIFHQPKVASISFIISFHIAQKLFAKLLY
jgi:hypothetical protein